MSSRVQQQPQAGLPRSQSRVEPVIAADEGVPLTPPHVNDTRPPSTGPGPRTGVPLTPDALDGEPEKGDLE